jgi:hypothetical protein
MATSRDFVLVDYRLIFWAGLVFGFIGALGRLWGMAVFGVLLAVVGLINKRKWGKPRMWSELSPPERRKQLMGVIAFAILGLVMIVASVATKTQTAGG